MSKPARGVALCLVVSTTLSFLIGCANRSTQEPMICMLTQLQAQSCLRPSGFVGPRVAFHWQNSEGTKAYFQEVGENNRPGRVWVVSEANPSDPKVIVIAEERAWIDGGDVVHSLPKFVNVAEMRNLEIDRQSGYFFAVSRVGNTMRIGHFLGNGWLYETSVDPQSFLPWQIFAAKSKLLILDVRDSNQATMFSSYRNLWILSPDGKSPQGFTREERKLAWHGICTDPSGSALLCSSYGFGNIPWPSSLGLYCVDTGHTIRVRTFLNDSMLFVLHSDFISPLLHRSERKGKVDTLVEPGCG